MGNSSRIARILHTSGYYLLRSLQNYLGDINLALADEYKNHLSLMIFSYERQIFYNDGMIGLLEKP